MSHVVTIECEIRDPAALAAACRRLGLAEPVRGKATLFVTEATGWIVNLPGWRYPVVVDTDARQLHYDTYEGRWGEQTQLDRLMQAYAVEKLKLESRRAGHVITEQPLPDGSVRLTIQVEGNA